MNVIISNKYQSLLGTLNIDVIKSINGVFEVSELVNQFTHFFYNKMIIDVTAIKDYENINVIQEISLNFDMSKVILLLDDSETVNSPKYLSQLVSMGIYNFTKKPDVVTFLIDNPNSYKDVASYQQLNATIETEKEIKLNTKVDNTKGFIGQRVIGIKNLTTHAGSTTLAYMLKMHLSKHYTVKCVELDTNDFMYFSDKDLEFTTSDNINSYIANNSDKEIIIVDLNNSQGLVNSETLYLIEPGIIKLNKLIKADNKIFDKIKNEKIILNRSSLTSKDVTDFERESGSKIFANIPNLDDKMDKDPVITSLLISLGFTRLSEKDESKGVFGIF